MNENDFNFILNLNRPRNLLIFHKDNSIYAWFIYNEENKC